MNREQLNNILNRRPVCAHCPVLRAKKRLPASQSGAAIPSMIIPVFRNATKGISGNMNGTDSTKHRIPDSVNADATRRDPGPSAILRILTANQAIKTALKQTMLAEKNDISSPELRATLLPKQLLKGILFFRPGNRMSPHKKTQTNMPSNTYGNSGN